jgi:hypothetical protein
VDEGSIPDRGRFFPLRHRVQTGSGAHPTFLLGAGALSLGLRREVDHLFPSSAEFMNAWSYTSIPPVRLHGVVLMFT